MRSLSSGTGAAYVDIEVARDALLARADCTDAIGVIGFCMGGGFALMTANRGFEAAAVNYGILPKDLDLALAGACPIVTSYGANDVTLRGATAKLDAALTRQAVPHDSKEYPGAGHVFMNQALNGPGWLRPIVRTLNFGPRPEAAADAWSRIDAFFTRYLVTPGR
jgi:carboxymethylenebutenolidase